jgi:hypothetical protein
MAEIQQLFHELEQRYVSLQNEYQSVVTDRDILRSKCRLLFLIFFNM